MSRLIQLVAGMAMLAGSAVLAGGTHQHDPAPATGAVSADPAFDALMAEAMRRMHAGMAAVPRTGQPDRDFLAAMVPHHQGAIDMAKAVLLATQDARIRNLAQSIITEQTYEIELMKSLLAQENATSHDQENRK